MLPSADTGDWSLLICKDQPMQRCHAVLHFILYNYLQMSLWSTLCHWPGQEKFKPCFMLIYDTHGGGIRLSQFYGAVTTALQIWQNIVVRMRKFIFIKGIKILLKPPYKNWTVHDTENCIRENSAHWLIYQNYSKSAMSRKWSLLQNCLPCDREGQGYWIHKRTFTHKKRRFFRHLYYKHGRWRPSFFCDHVLIHVQKYSLSNRKESNIA